MTTHEYLTRIYCAIADRETHVINNIGGELSVDSESIFRDAQNKAKLDTLREIKFYILELMEEPKTNEDMFRNLSRIELIDYLAVRGCPPPYSDVCPEPRNLCVICWDNWLKKGCERNDSQRI